MQHLHAIAGRKQSLHTGDAVLLKVSGEELEGRGLDGLCRYISYLQRMKLRTVLALGGGAQIDAEHSNKYGTQRERVQGKSPVDECAQDAYLKIQRDLRDWIRNIQFIDSSAIRVSEDVIDLSATSLEEDANSVTAFGFIGDSGEKQFNLNADDVASAISRQFDRVRMAIFCTGVGCIYGKHAWRIPVLHSQHIQSDGSHVFVHTDKGIRPKLRAIKNSGLSDVLITSAARLRETLDIWEMHAEGGTIVRNQQLDDIDMLS